MKMSKKSVVNSASRVGGGIVGAVASDYATDFIADSVDKTGKNKMYIKAGVVALSILGSSMVTGATNDKQFVKGTVEGAAIKQGAELLADLIMPKIVTPAKEEENRFMLNGALNCGCQPQEQAYLQPMSPLNGLLIEEENEVPFGSIKNESFTKYLG